MNASARLLLSRALTAKMGLWLCTVMVWYTVGVCGMGCVRGAGGLTGRMVGERLTYDVLSPALLPRRSLLSFPSLRSVPLYLSLWLFACVCVCVCVCVAFVFPVRQFFANRIHLSPASLFLVACPTSYYPTHHRALYVVRVQVLYSTEKLCQNSCRLDGG